MEIRKQIILIITNRFDFTADYVIRELSRRGEIFFRINSEDLIDQPVAATFPDWSYQITSQGRLIDIGSDLKSVWFRRPGKPFEWIQPQDKPSPQVIRFVEDQWHSFLEGLLAIPDVLWVNHISRNQDAECKIVQLKAAQNVGFKIPKTCITSDMDKAKAFCDMLDGKVVAKALYAPLIEYDDRDFFIFTNKVDPEDLEEDSLRLAPCVFQELISPKSDYRVTVVGKDIYSVKVKPKNAYIDWRREKEEVAFEKSDLPSDVIRFCFNLVAELGLVFGAIDLVEKNGEYYFLEINPNGEWAWLQEEVGLDISGSIARTLGLRL